jgi:hypothetical protein
MSNHDFSKLYSLQDRFLEFVRSNPFPFYLTGGTALDRFYLHHRFSEDLDFFSNNMSDFRSFLEKYITRVASVFTLDKNESLFYDDFIRIYIQQNELKLKVEFVNDVEYRVGIPVETIRGLVDTPANILSNKLTALINREEPKDMFDIILLSLRYNFNWSEIFSHSKRKAFINEIEVEQKIKSFPIALFRQTSCFKEKQDLNFFEKYIQTIADDFLLGAENSLCNTNTSIYYAVPEYR